MAELLFDDLVLHAETFAFDDDSIDVVHDAIENGGGQRAVIIEDLCPVLVDAVGCDHDRGALVALADDLEQQICTVLVDGEVAELIESCRALHESTYVESAFMWSDLSGLIAGTASRVFDST